MNMFTSMQNLKKLKAAYDEGLLSALVGSGFSKNVYGEYPSWPELLEDIIMELYPTEYKKVLRERQKAKEGEKNRPLNRLVNRLGPLNLVSKYIEYRGVGHEAIDVYIESKIPVLETRGDKLFIKDVEISREALSAHEALLNCERIRNIYTTNYENLLEEIRSFLDIPHFKTTIRNSQDLSNSLSKQSIIKVHGNLRTGGEPGKYGFDTDKNLLYIISKEDYETYQQKHEAFSFMMRMAMLQGKFCLVGFSGNDPNFQFWLQWMKEILDKEDTEEIKVFLIDFQEEELAEDVKLFYENHHIGAINLLDPDVQGVLFPEANQNLDYSSSTGGERAKSPKDLITELFRYLKGGDDWGARKGQGKYYSLWAEAEQLVNNKQDVAAVVKRLLKVRESLGPQKSVEHQDLILKQLHRKKDWEDADAELFAVAVSDMGLFPQAFALELESRDNNLTKLEIWKWLQNREDTLAGEDTLLQGDNDKVLYENALRLLFNFRYTELKELLMKWSPSGDYLYRAALLLSFFDKDKAKEYCDRYIADINGHSAQKVMMASQVANLLYGEFPNHYPLDKFFDQGLSSFGDTILYISRGISPKPKKILPYSFEDRTICLNPGNKPFRESSRILSYLMVWGYTTYYKYITCIPEEVWMQVFVELFEYYPFAVLYYSSLYTNEKMLRRIGQEYAYSRFLYKHQTQKDVLQCAFRGMSDEYMPWQNRKGLLIIVGEIYVCINESEWYDDFKEVILIPYLTSVNKNSESKGEVYTNIEKAFENIRERDHVADCFNILLGFFDNNTKLISGLINNELNVKSLERKDCEESVKSLIEDNPLSDIYSIVYILSHYGLLSEDVIHSLDEKARHEGMAFVRNDNIALIQLSYILSDEDNLAALKKFVLGKDVWDCGIREGSFSFPSPFGINRLSDKIVWSETEQSILFKNLEKNLDLITHRDKRSMLEPLLYSKNADLLFNMLSFFSKFYGPGENEALENRIKEAFNKECEISHNLKGLTSDDEDHVFIAIRIMNTVLSNNTVAKQLHEVYAVLNRALQKNPVALSLVLSEIRLLVENHEREMWGIYHDVLLQLLRDYMNIDYRPLNLNLSCAYQYLNRIALSAKNQGVKDECLDYWLADNEVLRFNNVG